MQVETLYDYRVAPGIDRVELPIFLQAPRPIVIPPKPAGDAAIPLADMIANWTSAIQAWFTNYVPSAFDGRLRFDLTILSNLTVQPMPLLRLRNLNLALQYIEPPLAAS